jgi:AAA ATPase domain/Histidine kinase-, DNA gyrase B-, and HSP90-like ATPase
VRQRPSCERGALFSSEFDLPAAIENALTLVRERAGRRSIALHTNIDNRLGQIQADERKVRQVVLNLLSNAIKFTPEGGRIEVAAVPKDGSVEVSVSDTGDGVVWQEGHCLSFGRAMAFHPLVDLIRRRFSVEESDDETAIASKIERGLREISDDLPVVSPYLRAVLSIDPGDAEVRGMTPAQRRGETLEALRRLLVRAAERRPQVLVVEDLHWIDSASEQFLVQRRDQSRWAALASGLGPTVRLGSAWSKEDANAT